METIALVWWAPAGSGRQFTMSFQRPAPFTMWTCCYEKFVVEKIGEQGPQTFSDVKPAPGTVWSISGDLFKIIGPNS